MGTKDPLPAGIAFLLAGIVCLGFGSWTVWHAWGNQAWPTVKGKMESTQVESYRTGSSRSKKTRYRAVLRFSYSVAGTTHQGEQSFDGFTTHASAKQRVADWSAGPLTVYVDPGDPGNVALTPGAEGGAWVLIAFGPVFAGLGGWMTAKGVHRRRLLAA